MGFYEKYRYSFQNAGTCQPNPRASVREPGIDQRAGPSRKFPFPAISHVVALAVSIYPCPDANCTECSGGE